MINGEKEKHELLKKLEAVLFLASRYVFLDELAVFTNINPVTLKELLKELEDSYKSRNSSISIIRRDLEGKEAWKMDVNVEFHSLINKIATGKTEFTKAEQETLAVIAYKQPIRQSVIVKIRGNKAYEHVKSLVSAGLIKSRKLGRTLELSLTDNFYNYFNLKNEKIENKNLENKSLENKDLKS